MVCLVLLSFGWLSLGKLSKVRLLGQGAFQRVWTALCLQQGAKSDFEELHLLMCVCSRTQELIQTQKLLRILVLFSISLQCLGAL